MLLMALPNEHQFTFNQYKDAKTLFAAIQTRFGGNDARKKTQKKLLKQMYENFNALSTESLDSIFNRLQKTVSQLAILGENISQEDLNLKFLRSLPSEWNPHVVVWRNKPDLDSMSFDYLYNNFKIIEQEVKRTGASSSNSSSQNMSFVSTPSSTNDVNTANVQVSTASSSVSTDSTQDSTASLNDLKKMDLKWQLALLSMRARKYYQRTGKKITINGSDTAGYDKSKVECFNCHKMGHFARECRGPRNQESRPRNQDSSRRTVNLEDTSSKAMVAIDGARFDWSFMAEEEVTINMTLMAFSDSEVYNDKTCPNTCLKSSEALKTELDNLRVEFNKSEFNLATYKRGLSSVEEQLVFYKKNEVMFCDQIAVLKRDALFKDSEINTLKIEIGKLKNEKESNQIKINKFENASKSLDKLIGSQISDNSRKGVGYNVVPPPPTGLFAPLIIDLSYSGLEEFQQPEFQGYGPKASKSVCVGTSNEVKTTPATPLVEELVSEKEKHTIFPTKIEFVKQQDKTARKPVKYAKMYRSQKPRGNQRNWNNLKSQQLGSDFVMYNKACFVCGSFDHVQAHCKYHQREGMLYRNNYNMVNYNYTSNITHPNTQRNMVPRAVLMKTGPKPFNIAKTVNTAHPKSIISKSLMEDMLPLVEESEEERSLVKMYDKKNCVLFTDTACFVLSPDFKLPDESQILLKIPRKNNMYSVDMKNIVPKESLTCLVAKATLDESMIWHRRHDKQIEYLMLNASPLKYCLRGGYLCQYADTKIPQSSGPPVKVGDEAVHKELGDKMERAATTTSSLEAKQDSDAQTRFETTSKQSNDPPLSRVNTLGSGEDNMKLMELMAHCTTLSELNLNSLSIHQMASLEFCDKHNMVAYLEKSEGSEGFHQIIDFLTASHIKNALTECPTLYASPIEQFWQTAALSTTEDGVRGITATIDRKVKVFVSEASIRRHLKLEDSDGISSLPTAEIFEQLALMGYECMNSTTFI
ncbi:ribonuclease H-like domain-containing protein [Tanacetum coccineum]